MKALMAILLTLPILFHSEQKTSVKTALSGYDLSDKRPRQFVLPQKLSEASGLVMTDDGRLFCHDDERAVVYQIDYSNGTVVKQFSLGRFGVRGDFEDIAVAGKLFYLVESNGTIYEFPEGGNGQTVEFRMYKTQLTTKNDVEGLEYDPETHSLLLACKVFPGKGYERNRAVYSFSLKTKQLSATPRFLIPLKEIRSKEFKPSGIARHPKTGTFFVIAARGSTIIEISKEGKILNQQPINSKVNTHPEGIAFAPDLTLVLCNDGQGKRGTLTLYPRTKL